MSRKLKVQGYCHICGAYGELSEEHVPPQEAFNKERLIGLSFDEAMRQGPFETKGRTLQGGAHFSTLCETCNNSTGGWYGNAFIDFCRQGMSILKRTGGKPSLVYLYRGYPLRIIKQVATMFFSVNTPEFAHAQPDLRDFVLNKEARGLPPDIRFHVYYNREGRARYYSPVAILDIRGGQSHMFSEITLPPFGYVMTLGTPPPHEDMVDITFFSRYRFGDRRDLEIRAPVLPTHMIVPGDYRPLNPPPNSPRSAVIG